MARTGRPPKPLALKILNGSAAHDPQRVNKNPAQPVDRLPIMPPDLSPAAQAVWQRVLADQAPGIILAAHADLLEIYCEAIVRHKQAVVVLSGSGLLIRGSRGQALVRNPLLAIVHAEADLVRAAGSELGLSPSSVSRFANVRPPIPADNSILALLTPCRPRRPA